LRAAQRAPQRIDDGVAREDDLLGRHGFAQQIGASAEGRREVQVRQARREQAVGLLREGAAAIAGAQPGLDVADGDAGIERRQRAGEGGRRVALHQHPVGRDARKHGGEPFDAACHHVGQCLAGPHQVEIDVGAQSELVHHVVDELAMLARADHADIVNVRLRPCGKHHGCKLDGLRSRADDRGDAQAAAHVSGSSSCASGGRAGSPAPARRTPCWS
jgi:hypothetical protein